MPFPQQRVPDVEQKRPYPLLPTVFQICKKVEQVVYQPYSLRRPLVLPQMKRHIVPTETPLPKPTHLVVPQFLLDAYDQRDQLRDILKKVQQPRVYASFRAKTALQELLNEVPHER